MNRRRVLAIIMSVFMMLSLLPTAVFAETAAVLDGQLKIQGAATEGTTLSADFKEVKNEGITEDSVSYQWFRKTADDEKKEQQGQKAELKLLGKEKNYKITKDDIDSRIVLTITGAEDKGFSGSLTAVTETVTETPGSDDSETGQDAEASEEDLNKEQDSDNSENTSEEVQQIPEPETNEETAGSESVDGIPAATNDTENTDSSLPEQDSEEQEQEEYQEEQQPADETDSTSDEQETSEDAGASAVDGIPAATEDGTYKNGQETPEATDEMSYQAEAEVGDGSSDVVEFGTVVSGQEDEQAQYVTIKNTGTETLNFIEMSPEHFAVQDITEPLEAGQSVQVRIAPRAGTQPGTYEDTITYQTEEGAEASFDARMVITENNISAGAEDEILIPDSSDDTNETPTPVPADNTNGTADSSSDDANETLTPVPSNDADTTITPEPSDDADTTVTPAPVSKVSSDLSAADFGSVVEGYTESPQAQTATLTNEGDADAVLSDVRSDQGDIRYFDVALSAQNVSANGGTATFTVRPKAGLTAGTYTETFTITDTTSGQEIVIPASITVNAASHKLGISTDTVDFASAKKGYSGIAAQQITVTNNGNVTETLTQPSAEYFTVTAASDLTIQPGKTAAFTVTPKDGLDVNTYQENIKIVSAATEAVFRASFQVLKGTVSLTKIQNPSEISGIANGTAKDAQKLKLPSTVVIETTGGNAKAKVTWDVKNSTYNASSADAQSFTVKGTVTLPDGVDNDNNIELSAYVKVNVEAYVPKTASADDNKITGIEYNGVYTTQSRISFTAVGAGMDNDSPGKGDTRYVPLNWTVINTNAWDKAPYTACFGLSKSGDYTLKVIFQQQQYNGESWKATEKQDTKQVAFSVSQAKVTAPGTNLTPSLNQKKSVRTNDPTVILPFVIILIIAAGAVSGVIIYKKKKK